MSEVLPFGGDFNDDFGPEFAPRFRRPDILARARIYRMREAIVAGLKTRFPDIEVKAHPGRLDISEALAKDMFAPPSIAIAATKLKSDIRLSGADDLAANFVAYVVTEDLMVEGARVERDEMALAICEALLVSLSDDRFADWSVFNAGPPEDFEATPLFTAKIFERGALYYAVSWKQTLHAVAPAFFGTEGLL